MVGHCLPDNALCSAPVNEVVMNVAEVVNKRKCASSRTSGSRNKVFKRCVQSQFFQEIPIPNLELACKERMSKDAINYIQNS